MFQRQQASQSAPEPAPSTHQAAGPAVGPGVAGRAPGAAAGAAASPPGVAAQCSPGAPDAEKAAFLAQPVYGPQDLAHAISVGSGTGIGGFEATYIPGAAMLLIRVTGKVQFRDAVQGSPGSFTTQHSDLSNLVTWLNSLPPATATQVLPFFQWTDQSKQESLARFNARLAEATSIWQGAGLSFQVNDPAWCDVTARPLFALQVGAEGTAAAGEHLQVTIYKEPTAEERARLDALLARNRTAVPNGTGVGIRANAGSNLNSNAPGATGNATDENALQNEMSLSSSDLTTTDDPRERGGDHNLKRSILFRHGEHALTGTQATDLQSWITQFADGDTIAQNNAITLRGFASARGSADFNRDLVDRRIASVRTAIVGAGVAAARISTDNRGDAEAESAEVGRDAAAQANERRVEVRIGSGQRQNTVAHEFGHVFGLSDEYTEGSNTPGQTAWHDPTATAAGVQGGAQHEQNDNIISQGNTVRPQHYATFAWALNQLTAARLGTRVWHVRQ
jgi:outer membrane protein OmpA-like peptidoglycan-associated protein